MKLVIDIEKLKRHKEYMCILRYNRLMRYALAGAELTQITQGTEDTFFRINGERFTLPNKILK